MRLIRLAAALLVLGVGACSTAPTGDTSTLLIDQPEGPFPYNSRFCT